ncbi:hydrogenase maturation protease [Lyngbya aestuarii]|uniref:hydrogenase maturation protease n=1 Tax=Lyngbya aestuarii TaxID=118322 RepID=UPI00403E249F
MSSSTFATNLNNQVEPKPISFLVIGYGNTLRSDDAVGQQVATEVARWELPLVYSLAVHQLTPELVEKIKIAECVIFVDACPITEEASVVQVHPLKPVTTGNFLLGHTSDPQALLAMSQAVYCYAPLAWLITIPAINFELGETLSPIAQQGVITALEKVRLLVQPQAKESQDA